MTSSNGTNMGEKYDGEPESPTPVGDHSVGEVAVAGPNELHRRLKGRHMQMIAIGGAIGAGLFISSGGAFQTGGPASVLIGFSIIGIMMVLMMQALAELSVMYPINGAFTIYIVRFIDPSWGFACSWEYAISWLTVLPFEISAACNIIHYWQGSEGINNSAWIVPILVALVAIQVFGIKGYGEVEFVLSLMKVIACIGFIILGIITNVGGVPTDDRGYIGTRYWSAPWSGFLNGFQGFCSVFVSAAFAYVGTELTGLAAAETIDPKKEIPRASKQVVWRILIFYIVNLFLIGLNVPADSPLYSGEGSTSRHSPFVIAIQLAGIKVLPSIFNAVILISVLSVANSCTFGSTRTIQALAGIGMAPNALTKIDNKGRPVPVIILQLLFGCLAFINLADNGGVIFNWLLALSSISALFVYGSIAVAHIRFRMAWKAQGHTLDELPYQAFFGVWGSYVCVLINVLAFIGQTYVALYPVGGSPNANGFFQAYLAVPLAIALYIGWKVYSWFYYPEHRAIWVPINKIDVYKGMREIQGAATEDLQPAEKRRGIKGFAMGIVRSIV